MNIFKKIGTALGLTSVKPSRIDLEAQAARQKQLSQNLLNEQTAKSVQKEQVDMYKRKKVL